MKNFKFFDVKKPNGVVNPNPFGEQPNRWIIEINEPGHRTFFNETIMSYYYSQNIVNNYGIPTIEHVHRTLVIVIDRESQIIGPLLDIFGCDQLLTFKLKCHGNDTVGRTIQYSGLVTSYLYNPNLEVQFNIQTVIDL